MRPDPPEAQHSRSAHLLGWAWPGPGPGPAAASRVCSGPGSLSCSPAMPPPPHFQSLPLAGEDLAGTRGGLAALGTLATAPLGCFTPCLAFRSWCGPRAGPAGGQRLRRCILDGDTACGSGLGGEPSWTPPGLSSWARTEGRVGAHSFHRLARGWAGMPRPTRGLLGTPPPSPGCGHGLAGLPRPGPDLEEHARGPRWQAARTAEEPLCLPPAHSGQRLHWTQSSWQMTQDLWGRPPPLLPLPGGCGPCVSRAGGFQRLGSWL